MKHLDRNIKIFFHLGREGSIWRKNNGFSLIENLDAMSIIMMLVGTILPVYQLIHKEEKNLEENLLVQSRLHDILRKEHQIKRLPTVFHETVNHKKVDIKVTQEEEWQKGCASWKIGRASCREAYEIESADV